MTTLSTSLRTNPQLNLSATATLPRKDPFKEGNHADYQLKEDPSEKGTLEKGPLKEAPLEKSHLEKPDIKQPEERQPKKAEDAQITEPNTEPQEHQRTSSNQDASSGSRTFSCPEASSPREP